MHLYDNENLQVRSDESRSPLLIAANGRTQNHFKVCEHIIQSEKHSKSLLLDQEHPKYGRPLWVAMLAGISDDRTKLEKDVSDRIALLMLKKHASVDFVCTSTKLSPFCQSHGNTVDPSHREKGIKVQVVRNSTGHKFLIGSLVEVMKEKAKIREDGDSFVVTSDSKKQEESKVLWEDVILARVEDTMNPLHLACLFGKDIIAAFILESVGDTIGGDDKTDHPFVDRVTERYNETALMLAAKTGSIKVVEILLEFNPNLKLRNKFNQTALLLATKSGHSFVVKQLLKTVNKNKKNKLLRDPDAYGKTPLHYAAAKGGKDLQKIFHYVLMHDSIPEVFWTAVSHGNEEFAFEHIYSLILECKKQVPRCPRGRYRGWTPLMWFCSVGHVKGVDFVLKSASDEEKKADPTDMKRLGSPLHICCASAPSIDKPKSREFRHICQLLLDTSEAVESFKLVNDAGYTPFWLAARNGAFYLLPLLVAHRHFIDELSKKESTDKNEHAECANEDDSSDEEDTVANVGQKHDHKHARDRDDKSDNKESNSSSDSVVEITPSMNAFLFSCEKGLLDVVEILLKQNEQLVSSKTDQSVTGLMLAAKNNHAHVLRYILNVIKPMSDFVSRRDAKDSKSMTALMYAATSCHADAVELMLSFGAVATDSFTDTPFWLATRFNAATPAETNAQIRVLEKLAEHGCDMKLFKPAVKPSVNLWSPRWPSELLLDSKVTPLMWACMQKNDVLAKKILGLRYFKEDATEKRKYVNANTALNTMTALHICVGTGNVDCAMLLLQNQGDINSKAWGEETPLMTAVRYIQAACVRMLLNKGAKADVLNKDGESPLALAVKLSLTLSLQSERRKSCEIALMLLEHDKKTLSIGGLFQKDVKNLNREITKDDKVKGTKVYVTDNQSNPKHNYRIGCVYSVHSVDEANGSFTAQLKDGSLGLPIQWIDVLKHESIGPWDLLTWAVFHDDVKLINALREHGLCDDETLNKRCTVMDDAEQTKHFCGSSYCCPMRSETPLIMASRSGCVKAARRLLELGADPNLQDENNWTALMYACNANPGWDKIVHDILQSLTKIVDSQNKQKIVNSQNKQGNTSLGMACFQQNRACVAELLKADFIDVNVRFTIPSIVHDKEKGKFAITRSAPKKRIVAKTSDRVFCPRNHELKQAPMRGWGCDGRHKPGGCPRGNARESFAEVEPFSCRSCDYDLCDKCTELERTKGRDFIISLSNLSLKTRVIITGNSNDHNYDLGKVYVVTLVDDDGTFKAKDPETDEEGNWLRFGDAKLETKPSAVPTETFVPCENGHPLQFFDLQKDGMWTCNGQLEGNCKHPNRASDEGDFDYDGVPVYSCNPCDYDLCKHCYESRIENEPNPGTKGAPVQEEERIVGTVVKVKYNNSEHDYDIGGVYQVSDIDEYQDSFRATSEKMGTKGSLIKWADVVLERIGSKLTDDNLLSVCCPKSHPLELNDDTTSNIKFNCSGTGRQHLCGGNTKYYVCKSCVEADTYGLCEECYSKTFFLLEAAARSQKPGEKIKVINRELGVLVEIAENSNSESYKPGQVNAFSFCERVFLGWGEVGVGKGPSLEE